MKKIKRQRQLFAGKSEDYIKGFMDAQKVLQEKLVDIQAKNAKILLGVYAPIVVSNRHRAISERRKEKGLPGINAYLVHAACFAQVPPHKFMALMDIQERALLLAIVELMTGIDPTLVNMGELVRAVIAEKDYETLQREYNERWEAMYKAEGGEYEDKTSTAETSQAGQEDHH